MYTIYRTYRFEITEINVSVQFFFAMPFTVKDDEASVSPNGQKHRLCASRSCLLDRIVITTRWRLLLSGHERDAQIHRRLVPFFSNGSSTHLRHLCPLQMEIRQKLPMSLRNLDSGYVNDMDRSKTISNANDE